jgi:hypothetical protein
MAEDGQTRAEIDAAYEKELLALGFSGGKPPELNKQFGTYEHYVVVDKMVQTTSNAAQRPDGSWVKGVVPTQVSQEEAITASKLSCVRAINRLRHAADGDLSKVRKIANIRYMTASPPSYTGHSEVANACSDMMIRVFGRAVGTHTRTVMGVTSFPWDMTHKIDLTAYLK